MSFPQRRSRYFSFARVVQQEAGGGGVATVVQTITGGHVQWLNHSSTTQALTFGSPVTAGNSVIVICSGYSPVFTHSAPTDTAGNTYSIPQDSSSGEADSGPPDFAVEAFIYAAHNVTGGFTTVTLNGLIGAGVYGQVTAIEVSGLASSPNDRAAGANLVGPTSTDGNVAIGTLAQADEFVVAVLANSDDADNNANISGPTGGGTYTNLYREQDGAANSAGSADYTSTSATSGFTVQYAHDNFAGGQEWAIAVATFKIAAAAADTELVVQDALHAHSVDAPVLIEQEVLTVADALHAHAVDNLALLQANLLAVADALHAHSVDNVALVEQEVLAMQDASHAHTADNVVLTEQEVLAVLDATHGHTSDTIGLVQQNLLAVADSSHSHTADNLDLDMTLLLVVADAVHAHLADNIALIQQNLLAVADATHAHSAEGLTLDVSDLLQVADSIHAHAADSVALVQQNLLAVQDSTHAHLAEQMSLIQGYLLSVNDAIHAHSSDGVVLVFSDVLQVADALHAHIADLVELQQANVLSVQDAAHEHLAESILLHLQGLVSIIGAVATVTAAIGKAAAIQGTNKQAAIGSPAGNVSSIDGGSKKASVTVIGISGRVH